MSTDAPSEPGRVGFDRGSYLFISGIPVVRMIDGDALHQPPAHAAHAAAAGSSRARFALGLAVVLCFYLALSGVWTFMGQISAAAGNTPARPA